MRQVRAAEHAVIVGGGYAGERLAAALREQSVAVTVTTRSGRTVAGGASLALDLDHSQTLALPPHDVLFYLAPPPPDGETDPRSAALTAALERHRRPLRAAVLVSTTGVYGGCAGAVVDETTPPNPGTARGRRRVASEAVWRLACARWRCPLAVLRVAGIYGPGRLPIKRLESGEPVLRSALAPLSNRIHIDDLVSALRYSVGLDGTLDVADGTARPVTDFYHALADATGRPRLPETDERERVPVLRAGFGESRQVPALRLLTLLGGLRYADLGEGVRASVAVEAGAIGVRT